MSPCHIAPYMGICVLRVRVVPKHTRKMRVRVVSNGRSSDHERQLRCRNILLRSMVLRSVVPNKCTFSASSFAGAGGIVVMVFSYCMLGGKRTIVHKRETTATHPFLFPNLVLSSALERTRLRKSSRCDIRTGRHYSYLERIRVLSPLRKKHYR